MFWHCLSLCPNSNKHYETICQNVFNRSDQNATDPFEYGEDCGLTLYSPGFVLLLWLSICSRYRIRKMDSFHIWLLYRVFWLNLHSNVNKKEWNRIRFIYIYLWAVLIYWYYSAEMGYFADAADQSVPMYFEISQCLHILGNFGGNYEILL